MPSVPNSNEPKAPHSDVKSGLEREAYEKTLGGQPEEKKIDAIAKANTPRARGKAPGSVRV